MYLSKERDTSIDILRAIALLGLIAAHVEPSDFIFQLRNFDVPMMVVLSGVAFSMTVSNTNISYTDYVWKRFVRIIVPTWIFLLIYYLLIEPTPFLLIIRKFDLMTSWYVWIMRVFFVIALFAPFVATLINKLKKSSVLIFLGSLFLLNEFLCRQAWAQGGGSDKNVIILMNLPYILVFSFGYILKNLTNKQVLCILLSSIGIYLFKGLYLWNKTGEYVLTQAEKYPPRLYYLAYAFTCICALWLLRNQIRRFSQKCQIGALFSFIGSHTMWIYFYHILAIDLLPHTTSGIIRYIIVLCLATLVTYIQYVVLSYITRKVPTRIGNTLNVIFNG